MKRGFTLAEVMTVIALIGVLSAVAIPTFSRHMAGQKDRQLRVELDIVRQAAERFQSDTGLWPSTLADLSVASAPSTGYLPGVGTVTLVSRKFRGPYLQRIPTDAISGQAFTYTLSAEGAKIVASAAGNDQSGVAYASY